MNSDQISKQIINSEQFWWKFFLSIKSVSFDILFKFFSLRIHSVHFEIRIKVEKSYHHIRYSNREKM